MRWWILSLSVIVISGLAYGIWATFVKEPDVSTAPVYHGLNRKEVIRVLGQPDEQLKYQLKDAIGGLREPALKKHYKVEDESNRHVEIEELWWRDGAFWLTLWLHRVNHNWVVFESCRWRATIQF